MIYSDFVMVKEILIMLLHIICENTCYKITVTHALFCLIAVCFNDVLRTPSC